MQGILLKVNILNGIKYIGPTIDKAYIDLTEDVQVKRMLHSFGVLSTSSAS